MNGNVPVKCIETIVLEIVDRHWCTRRRGIFDIRKFNPREAADVFLRKYQGESFIKTQKIHIRYNNQELHFCVRDLIYGTINKVSNTTVEFIYQKTMFKKIRWSGYRTNRVRWANDNNELVSRNLTMPSFQNEIPEIRIDDGYSSIIIDGPTSINTQIMSCENLDDDQLLSMNSFCRSVSGKTADDETHFRSSIYVHINQ